MIPIMRPLLPPADRLLPYLECIDKSRWYSNNGYFNTQFEERLSELFNCPVATASSGTSALTATLLALELPVNSLIGTYAWTFVATASAIVAAGHKPYFSAAHITHNADAFVKVAPLGKYARVMTKTSDIPVIVDAASSFDSYSLKDRFFLRPSEPTIISTHCTKTFCTAEGGIILCPDEEYKKKIRSILNQGMLPDKTCAYKGINGKLSEYHVAIGLAELDEWEQKREKWLEIQHWYGDQTNYATSTYHKTLLTAAAPIVDKLSAMGIQARASWYGGFYSHSAFKDYPRDDLFPIDDWTTHTIFLPKYISMTKEDVKRIQEALEECLN